MSTALLVRPGVDHKTQLQQHFPKRHLLSIVVGSEDLDFLGHVNNVRYVDWMERVGWSHSEAAGINFDAFQQHQSAMVSRRHEIDYLTACQAGQCVYLSSWVGEAVGHSGFWRHFEFYVTTTSHPVWQRVLVAKSHWVCIDLASGRPKRLPPAFRQAYLGH